ncbi:polycomb group protein EMF2B-like isoform X1 [Elaeis guineensis]|uniref:LOW QUALITY PROTEIN: polycomb group protein EMF2B-like n=1 Tax=Elaeis guineensis var. tenera TaxID=51953 RepID=A0A6I9QA32_ELAGV|nr:LOW QUALITY PROTEIN: polycomb group protein EMF2B-like [Elaeis guineensis]
MPGLPLAVRETTCSHSRTADQMCRQQSRVRLTAEEQLAAEESLSVYCKPVELYNILQRRAIRNPSFLQRCLQYKIEAKRKRRIQIAVSLSGNINVEVRPQDLFPLYVLLGRPVGDVTEHHAVYQLSRACVISTFNEYGKKDQIEANFVIPEIKKLASDARVRNLNIILISSGEPKGASGESHLLVDHEELTSFPTELEGNCLWGKIPINSLCSSLEKCVTLSLGHKAEMLSTVNMHPSSLEPKFLNQNNCMTFRFHNMDFMNSYQVQVSICAQEIGARETSPYDSYSYDDVPTSSLPHIIRLRTGNVLFNYRYYNNTLQKTEVTEDFSCPFCLVQCASFKGLRYHLTSSHDLFNFEFWVTEEYQAVNVSVRMDTWRSEVLSDGVDPRLQTFFYCSKFKRRRKSKNLVHNVSHVHPHVLELESPEAAQEGSHEDYAQKENGTCSSHRPIAYPTDVALINGYNDSGSYKEEKLHKSSFSEAQLISARHKSESFGSENHHAAECTELGSSSPDTTGICAATAQASISNDCAQPGSGSNLAPPTVLQFAKTRKLSVERTDPRSRALLQKRQFFHSHRAQPMALEQVFSDRDSEDEVDDDIADFEDRRMLDDFVDVTKDEKQIMHLWNSFVRKQRVLADGHIPWACEAFSQLHGQDLVRAPALLWCWRLFMIKLWNHSLLDARTMNNCNIILERFQNQSSDPKQS